MIIGIIGAENTHTVAIGNMINNEKLIKGFSVDYVWGETAALAQEAAKAGGIPNIVRHPKEMLGKVDAVIVDHRHPKYHLEAVLPFIKKCVPVFVDKPFCYRVSEGKRFLGIASKKNVPVTSHSALPLQKSFIKFKNDLQNIGKIIGGSTYGPCDLKSKYGGIFFYGIHQVDMILNAFGYNPSSVLVLRNGQNAIAQVFYPNDVIINLHLIKEGLSNFYITAIGNKSVIHAQIVFDKHTHLAGAKRFTKMFKTGIQPLTAQQILKPIQVLEALEKSVKSKRIEKIQN